MSNYDPKHTPRLSLDEIEEMEQKEKKAAAKKKFNIFNRLSKDGPGVEKDEITVAQKPNLPNFFKLFFGKISQFFSVNMLLVIGNFPLLFGMLALSGIFSQFTTTPYYSVYAPLHGAMMFDQSPATLVLASIFGRQADITILSTLDYILLGLCALVIVTFGLVRVGATYLVRNMFLGEPVFFMHDFFRTIKRNFRQALIFGILDIATIGLIIYDIFWFSINQGAGDAMFFMTYISIGLAIMYAIMRNYIYLMIVTFDLSLFKMYKNALLFIVLNLKRNIMLLLGLVAVAVLEYVLLSVFLPLGAVMPLAIIPALFLLIGVYAAFPKIKEIMIDPYYEKIKKTAPSEAEESKELN